MEKLCNILLIMTTSWNNKLLRQNQGNPVGNWLFWLPCFDNRALTQKQSKNVLTNISFWDHQLVFSNTPQM